MFAAIGIGLWWFASSALLSTWANTTFLRYFEDPILHTFIRFAGSAVLGFAILIIAREVKSLERVFKITQDVVVPAILLWIANYFNSVGLQIAGITLTYVVKACIPVFTVAVCTMQGQSFPLLIYISLIPICFGVALASGSDLDFSITGLSAALVSAIAQTFMNISIKSVRTKTGYTGPQAFMGMCIVCTFITMPVMLSTLSSNSVTAGDFATALSESRTISNMIRVYSSCQGGDFWPAILMSIAAVAYYMEYVLNFIFVGYVSSVTFSVSDIARRVAIIMTGAVVFQKPLTTMNWVGIAVALGGVLWYSFIDSQLAPSKPQEAAGGTVQATAKDIAEQNNSSKEKKKRK